MNKLFLLFILGSTTSYSTISYIGVSLESSLRIEIFLWLTGSSTIARGIGARSGGHEPIEPLHKNRVASSNFQKHKEQRIRIITDAYVVVSFPFSVANKYTSFNLEECPIDL
jgi:hypothetical protein